MATGWGSLDEAIAALAQKRIDAETELVSAILCRPRDGVELALRCGARAELFEQEDLRLIYLCAEDRVRFGDGSKLAVLVLAREELDRNGYWDEQAPGFERRGRWSNANLASLACGHFSPCFVPRLTADLLDIDDRLSEARRCWRRMMRLLRGDWDEVLVFKGCVEAKLPRKEESDGKAKGMERQGQAPKRGSGTVPGEAKRGKGATRTRRREGEVSTRQRSARGRAIYIRPGERPD